jgi:anti-anti-sigma factor
MNGEAYAVDWSFPAGMNRLSRLSGAPGQRVAQSVAEKPLGMEACLLDADGQTTVTVRGEVDLATAGALWETLQKAAVAGTTLVVDLSGTRFIDSSGLDLLLRARRNLATMGSTIVLRSPHQGVLKVLQVSGLDRIFTIELEPGPNVREGPRPE